MNKEEHKLNELLLVIATVFKIMGHVTLCGGLLIALGLLVFGGAHSLMAALMVFVFACVFWLFVLGLSEFIRLTNSIETDTVYFPVYLRWLFRGTSGSEFQSRHIPGELPKP